MTESTQDQISAFVDGELSADETEFLLRRLSHDDEARRHLNSYLAIGAAIRGDLIGDRAVALTGPVAAALDGTEDAVVALSETRGWLRFAKPLAGVAIAASVVVSALIVLQDSGTPGAPIAQIDSAAKTVRAPTYVVPVAQQEIPGLVRPRIRLTNYLVNHGQYASSLGRHRINSSVLAYEETPVPEPAATEEDDNDSE